MEFKQNKEETVSNNNLELSDIDQILPEIGGYGRYQLFIQIAVMFAAIAEPLQGLMMYYAADAPSWAYVANSTNCTNGATNSMKCTNGTEYPFHVLERCGMPRNSWQYTKSKEYSIVTEFGLDCDNAWIAQLPTSVFYLGTATGSIFLGWVGDNYGRRTVLVPSIWMIQIWGLACAFSPNIIVLVIFRFVAGFFVPGSIANLSAMMSELVLPKHRSWAVPAVFFLWPFELGVFSLMAYYVQEWRKLIIISTTPLFISAILTLAVPESMRWLLEKGRVEEVKSILQRTAYWNRKTLPNNICLQQRETIPRSSPKDLFANMRIALITIGICTLWFAYSLVYYGIPLAADDVTTGSMYINFTLVCIVELPALFFCAFGLSKLGRRSTTVGSFMICGFTCLFLAFSPNIDAWRIPRLVVGTVGRFFICITAAGIYTWTPELYPTLLRSQGISFGSIASKLGCTVMPWVVKSARNLHPIAPFLTMGILAVVVSIFLFKLPETKGILASNNEKEDENAKHHAKAQIGA